MIKVGDVGIFNEFNGYDWSKYENNEATVTEVNLEDECKSLFIMFNDNYILEIDTKEFIKHDYS